MAQLPYFNFNEQYYTYKAFGFAQDPTDFSNNKIVGDVEKYHTPDMTKSAFMTTGKSQKEYKKKENEPNTFVSTIEICCYFFGSLYR